MAENALEKLIAHGEDEGCVCLSHLQEVVQELELDDEQVQALYKQIEQRGVANKSRTIRIPVHILERETKIARAERELVTKLERQPTDEEIAKRAKLPIKQVREVRKAARAVTSLDRPLGDEGDASLGDVVA